MLDILLHVLQKAPRVRAVHLRMMKLKRQLNDCDGCFDGIISTVATVAAVALSSFDYFVLNIVDYHIGELHLPPGVFCSVLIPHMVLVQQPAGFNVPSQTLRIFRWGRETRGDSSQCIALSASHRSVARSCHSSQGGVVQR